MFFDIIGGIRLEIESTTGLKLFITKIAIEKWEIVIFSTKLTL